MWVILGWIETDAGSPVVRTFGESVNHGGVKLENEEGRGCSRVTVGLVVIGCWSESGRGMVMA